MKGSFYDNLAASLIASGDWRVIDPEAVVTTVHAYYRRLHEDAVRGGHARALPYTNSVQVALSRLRSRLAKHGVDPTFLKKLALTRHETTALAEAKNARVHKKSINVTSVAGDPIIEDCRQMLDDGMMEEDASKLIVALACLTGRRTSELVYSAVFDPPRGADHATSTRFWSCASGFAKQRKGDREAVKCRDIPFLAPRSDINRAVRILRRLWPATSIREVNRKYGAHAGRALQRYCDVLGNIHQFRKFYVLCCYHYFNDNNCSLPRLAADYLGHKTMSSTVITYLNFRVTDLGGLDFSVRNHDR